MFYFTFWAIGIITGIILICATLGSISFYLETKKAKKRYLQIFRKYLFGGKVTNLPGFSDSKFIIIRESIFGDKPNVLTVVKEKRNIYSFQLAEKGEVIERFKCQYDSNFFLCDYGQND